MSERRDSPPGARRPRSLRTADPFPFVADPELAEWLEKNADRLDVSPADVRQLDKPRKRGGPRGRKLA